MLTLSAVVGALPQIGATPTKPSAWSMKTRRRSPFMSPQSPRSPADRARSRRAPGRFARDPARRIRRGRSRTGPCRFDALRQSVQHHPRGGAVARPARPATTHSCWAASRRRSGSRRARPPKSRPPRTSTSTARARPARCRCSSRTTCRSATARSTPRAVRPAPPTTRRGSTGSSPASATVRRR